MTFTYVIFSVHYSLKDTKKIKCIILSVMEKNIARAKPFLYIALANYPASATSNSCTILFLTTWTYYFKNMSTTIYLLINIISIVNDNDYSQFLSNPSFQLREEK